MLLENSVYRFSYSLNVKKCIYSWYVKMLSGKDAAQHNNDIFSFLYRALCILARGISTTTLNVKDIRNCI